MTTTARRAAAGTGAVGGSTVAGRLNPVAKLAAIGVVTVPLLVSRDVVTSGVLVGAEVIALPLLGLGGRLLGRAWPLALGLATLWLANYLGRGSVSGMVGISLRLVALGLPGLLLVASTDPTDLADALVQKWRAPARVAYGALAAFRLLPLLADELGVIRRARRARGVSAGANPVAWVRTGVALLFAVLVQAIRRATRLAAAMDSRGFDAGRPRSFARVSIVRRTDRAFVAATVLVVVAAVTTSVLTGSWRFVLS